MIPENQKNCIDIEHFFKMNLGNWLTQKTSYNPSSKQHKTSTNKTCIEKIDKSATIKRLLKNNENRTILLQNDDLIYSIDSRIGNNSESSIITYKQQDPLKSNGKIYKINKNNTIISGKFQLVESVLKILINTNSLIIEETIWFINPNLKLTKSIIKKNKHCILISFTSEIKVK